MPVQKYDPAEYWKDGEWSWKKFYEQTPYGRYYTRTGLHLLTSVIRRHKPIHTVLDVGAGMGRFAIPLSRLGCKVTALDMDAHALEHLARAEQGVRTIVGDFLKQPLDQYDLVFSIGTAKYIQEFEQFLRKLHQALAPGGYLFLEMVNPASMRGKLRSRLLSILGKPSHQPNSFPTQLTPSACEGLLKRAGFRPVWKQGACLLTPSMDSKNDVLFRMSGWLERAGLSRWASFGTQYYVLARKVG